MQFHEILKKEALRFAKGNAIVFPGEIVTTLWGNWAKPHKVKIYEIGVGLSSKWDKKAKTFRAALEMCYSAKRLKADGSVKPQDRSHGIALSAFIKADGKKWKQSGQILNHGTFYWRLP